LISRTTAFLGIWRKREKEEPGLEKRFGSEYIDYKKNVPRWIPRLKPFIPDPVFK
jgi:protein-S-isoprenylcysteine O-methyltransferase Ste14